jgi:cobalt-zinc-cadmium efflux system protein
MHGGPDHSRGVGTGGSGAVRHRKQLGWALALTLAYMVAEVAGGLLTGSLALLADAAHMLTDAGGLALALFAIAFAQRPANRDKTFGYYRAEILAALVNAVVLLLVTAYILYEAYQRFLNPPEILPLPMIAVAVVGLIINLISMRLLSAGANDSLNVQGAYFEVFSDMLGSLGVIAAAIVVMLSGWKPVDPIIAAGIGLFIVPRTMRLLNQTTHILLEGVPQGMDIKKLESALASIPGVKKVCDLHVWALTSGVSAMSGHLVVDDMSRAQDTIRKARQLLKEEGIQHVTVQIEDEALHEEQASLTF